MGAGKKFAWIPEYFVRNYRMSYEARHLYIIYSIMAEYSACEGWVNVLGEPYVHVTEEILADKFGFYPDSLKKLHTELVGLNLIQSRGSTKLTGTYCFIVRYPESHTPDTYYIPEMPNAIHRSKKTLMYQWRALIRNMLNESELHPLAKHLYCEVLLPAALSYYSVTSLREDDVSLDKVMGEIQPASIMKIMSAMELRMSLNDVKQNMLRLQKKGLVLLAEISVDGVILEIKNPSRTSQAWNKKNHGQYTYVICLPEGGEKDYSVFFSDPKEHSELIEQIAGHFKGE